MIFLGFGDSDVIGPFFYLSYKKTQLVLACTYVLILPFLTKKEKAPWELSNPEKLEAAGKKKEEGNLLYKGGKYQRAAKKYDKVTQRHHLSIVSIIIFPLESHSILSKSNVFCLIRLQTMLVKTYLLGMMSSSWPKR